MNQVLPLLLRGPDLLGLLLQLLPVLAIVGICVYLVIEVERRKRKAARAVKGDGSSAPEVEVCEEDETDAAAGQALVTKDKDRADAAKWWAEQRQVVSIALDGPTWFEVDGVGTVEVDGTREEVSGKKKFETASIVEIRIDGSVKASFATGGLARIAEVGEVKIEGNGLIDVSANGSLNLGGSARYVVTRCPEVLVSHQSDGVVLEAHACSAVFGGDAREFYAYDCEKVYAKGCGFAYRCKKVNAQGNSRVYAAECTDVSATDKAKVRHRKCKNVSRSDESVLEPVE